MRQDGIEKPSTWLASVNAAYLGEYLDRNTAMARVEKDIEPNMEMVLHDWGLCQNQRERHQTSKDKEVQWPAEKLRTLLKIWTAASFW